MIASLADYRKVTKDTVSSDDDVTAALADAQEDLELFCRRQFEQAERTEDCRIYRETMRIYPRCTPLVSSSVPAGLTIDGNAFIGGYGFWPFDATVVNWFLVRPHVTVTYVGGYAADEMPHQLKVLVCEQAQAALSPVLLSTLPRGVASVHVGDVGYSGSNLGGLGGLAPSVARQARRWRRSVLLP